MTRLLKNGCTIDVDSMDLRAWFDTVSLFDDANLYQVWNEAGEARLLNSVSRIVVRREGEPVAASEVRLVTLPLGRGGIAYTLWGPMWRRRGEASDITSFRLAVQAMVDEYVRRRGLVLRLNPRLFLEQDQACLDVLREEGLLPADEARKKQSLIIDLSHGVDELRKALDKKWRNCLSKAERSGLEIVSGTSLDLFDEFAGVYEKMLARKQFEPSASIEKHRRMQTLLPDANKMDIVVARQDGVACAGAICVTFGDTAVYLFGATDDAGMKVSASYLVQWQVVSTLVARGVRYYDLNGINAEANPGTYHFKRGLAGRHAYEVTFSGLYNMYPNGAVRQAVALADKLRSQVKRGRRALAGA